MSTAAVYISLIFLLLQGLVSPCDVRAGEGALLFREYCAGCHGVAGKGGRAPALNKKGLLATADLDYFANTIRFGRPIRGCPSFDGKMAEGDILEIARYIESWRNGKLLKAPDHDVTPRNDERGREIFILCGGCHGVEGEGAMGPPLMDPGLLKSASDTVLRRTIMYGRPGTPMKGYLEGMGGLAVLTVDEIDRLIAYIRYRQKLKEEGGPEDPGP